VRCVFVLDILNGAVVHAVRGERRRYEPVERFSRIVSTSRPMDILRELRPAEVYIADLNLLTGTGENLSVIREASASARVMADIGISEAHDLDLLPPSVIPVLGTETAPLSLLREAAAQRGIIASIDMLGQRTLARDPELKTRNPLEVLRLLGDLPLEGVILLELDRVGTSSGLNRDFLVQARAISWHPLILGGGVRDEEDLQVLESLGFSGALVATAVHSGSISAAKLR